MKVQSIPFRELGFRSLFTDYLAQEAGACEFYELHPFQEGAARKRLDQLNDMDDSGHMEQQETFRASLVQALEAFHQPYAIKEITRRQILKLKNPTTKVVVTGQQLTLFGGPLFTVYKIATAIHYARLYEEELNCNVLPVFWLADEDHDFEEIRSTRIFSASSNLVDLRCNTSNCPNDLSGGANDEINASHASALHASVPNEEKPAAEIYPSEEALKSVFEQLGKDLPDTDFKEHLMKRLESYYSPDHSFRDAFALWILELFADEGLILCGSYDDSLKKLGRQVLKTYTEVARSFYDRVQEQSQKLKEAGYHEQVHPMLSNLFLYDDQKRRIKLTLDNEGWHAGDQAIQGDDLKKIADKSPETLSPNVLLRPIFQDELLPVLAYVAGPSELAYYAQLKHVYPLFGKKMPLIIPRFSITFVEPHIERAANQLPFQYPEYRGRTEDLEAAYIQQTDNLDVNDFFSAWLEAIHDESERRKVKISLLDKTLLGTASRAESVYKNELMKLKGKMIRSLKKRENDQIDRIQKVRHHLFPDGNLQEREISAIWLLNKYGRKVLDHMTEHLQGQVPDTHKFIFL